jgi:hypothetical protein
VASSDGLPTGQVADLAVSDSETTPLVRQVIITSGRDQLVLSWSSVARIEPRRLQLRAGASSAVTPAPIEHELQLVRDVLDAQIVDLAGHRLVRVGDVQLVRRSDGELVVVGVDVGFGAVVRRLGLRRLAGRLPEKVVPWPTLHLTSPHGHKVQLTCRAPRLTELSPDDLAHLLTRLSASHAADVVRAVPQEVARDALVRTHDEVASRLLGELDDDVADEVLESMPPSRATTLRRLARRPVPRRRYHRTRGWRRHAPRQRVP